MSSVRGFWGYVAACGEAALLVLTAEEEDSVVDLYACSVGLGVVVFCSSVCTGDFWIVAASPGPVLAVFPCCIVARYGGGEGCLGGDGDVVLSHDYHGTECE